MLGPGKARTRRSFMLRGYKRGYTKSDTSPTHLQHLAHSPTHMEDESTSIFRAHLER